MVILPYPLKKKGVRHPQNLNPSFSIFFILVIDVILMGFGYRLNKFYI